ncbi:MAG: transcription antitermination factor NusB [Thermoguttaceae bacterium]|nr:transcription antitermination factor NusB [Thermoguttaceae bacterium]
MTDDKKLSVYKLRSIGRLVAFQAAYQAEIREQADQNLRRQGEAQATVRETVAEYDPFAEPLDAYRAETKMFLTGAERSETLDFARRLFEGYRDRRAEVDALLDAALTNRTLARVDLVARCILRVAAYEIRFIKTPKAVVISQALELGKKFGEKETTRFLNGVLDRIDG